MSDEEVQDQEQEDQEQEDQKLETRRWESSTISRHARQMDSFKGKTEVKIGQCGSNSAGRVPPCQGGCREFESLLPLQKWNRLSTMTRAVLIMLV
jgi:hypothetical protein